MASTPRLVAPVFLVATPRADADAKVLLNSLALAAGVWAARTPDRSFLDDLPADSVSAAGGSAHAAAAHEALLAAVTDREERSV